MQYHGNKTLNQRVFKGIEYLRNKTLDQRVFEDIECNTMETKLYIKEFLKVLNAISWKEDFKSKSF